MKNEKTIKHALVGLTLSENAGDTNQEILILAKALGFPQPEWNEEYFRYIFEFENEPDFWENTP